MFTFIFFHVFEIFVVTTSLAVVGVLIFAIRHRAKLDAAEKAGGHHNVTVAEQMETRDVGLVSAGMAQTYKTKGKPIEDDTPDAD